MVKKYFLQHFQNIYENYGIKKLPIILLKIYCKTKLFQVDFNEESQINYDTYCEIINDK